MPIRVLAVVLGLTAMLSPLVSIASAGSPHFIYCQIVGAASDSLTVASKEAGLGDEFQVHAVLTAEAQCINPGSHHPEATNKEDVASAGDFPVQSGQSTYTLSVTATFQPECSPPMSVAFSNILITDVTNNLSCRP
jgi:hypothetical protein